MYSHTLHVLTYTTCTHIHYMYSHTLHVLAYATLTCTYIHYMYSHMLHYTMPADDHGVYSHNFARSQWADKVLCVRVCVYCLCSIM